MTREEFQDLVRQRLAENPEWRLGQAHFNTLMEVRPVLAGLIRGTEFDPWNVTGWRDEAWGKYLEILDANWDEFAPAGEPRDIAHTKEKATHEWPKGCFIQGGKSGLVMDTSGSGKHYTTAFVEAFPRETSGRPGTFIRGEGATIKAAEDAAWSHYEKWWNCSDDSGEHGEWERRHFKNGAAYCGKCGIWFSNVLPELPLTDEDRARQARSSLHRAFVGGEAEAVLDEILDAAATAEPRVQP